MCYCWTTSDNLSVAVVTDAEYPEGSAYNLIGQVILDFMQTFERNPEIYQDCEYDCDLPYENLGEFLKNWQDPAEADKLYKIKTELDDVKEIMHKNMSELIERGESLESLMEKSNDLSKMSVQFYKKAKKKNSQCCTLN